MSLQRLLSLPPLLLHYADGTITIWKESALLTTRLQPRSNIIIHTHHEMVVELDACSYGSGRRLMLLLPLLLRLRGSATSCGSSTLSYGRATASNAL
jgi:hypothetical protein